MLDWLTVAIMGVIGITAIRKYGAISAVAFFCIYNFLCCLALIFVNGFNLTKADFIIGRTFFSAMPMEDLQIYQTQVILTFFLLTLVALLAQIGIPKPGPEENSPIMAKSGVVPRQVEATLSGVGALIVLLIFVAVTVYHFTAMDFAVLWRNNSYLAIKTPHFVGLTEPLSIFYHFGFRIVGLASIVMLFYYNPAKRPLHFAIVFALAAYAVLILLAGNSRWVPLYFFAAAGASQIGKGRGALLWPILAAVGAFSFLIVINGRAQSEFGLSQIPHNMLRFAPSEIYRSLAGVFLNMFEGGLNLANSLRLSPVFTDRYQILSFSPFPSFIDGFSDIRDADKSKFALHVPMGGYGEVIHFAWPLKVLFVLILFLMFRSIGYFRIIANRYIFYGLNIYAIYAIYLMPTYSMRTSWRHVIVICVAGLCVVYWRKRKKSDSRRLTGTARPYAPMTPVVHPEPRVRN